jgi:hypothetical protein
MGSSDSIQDSHYHHPALTMVNRKGQLGLSLEQIIKIILFAAMLLVVIYMAYSMLEIFLAAREEYSAKQTVELMSKRIDHMLAAKEQQAFMIVHLPGSQPPEVKGKNMHIVGFGKDTKSATLQVSIQMEKERDPSVRYSSAPSVISKEAVEKPDSCGGSACICLFKDIASIGDQNRKAGEKNFDPIKCYKTNVDIEGSIPPGGPAVASLNLKDEVIHLTLLNLRGTAQ